MGSHDSFESHIADPIKAGDVLNNPDVVRICVEEGPERLEELLSLGVRFTVSGRGGDLDLTRQIEVPTSTTYGEAHAKRK